MSNLYRQTKPPKSAMEVFYAKWAPIVTGLGAAIVILGALFKIMHWNGAGPMLIIGLGTEAVLFAMFAFAPAHADPDWTIVYPQLSEEFGGDSSEIPSSANTTKKLDDMLASANINQDVLGRIGQGLNNLSTTVSKIGDMTDASVATQEFASKTKAATVSLESMSKAYSSTAEAMSGMASAAVDAREYHSQVQNITKNLSSLNAVYEMELQDANSHLKAMNKFYANLSSAMENMADASKDTDVFRKELGKLSSNLTMLNTVYGNMLTAMRGQ